MKDFDRVMAVNVRGVMLCYKHAAIQMKRQKRGGRLIGMSEHWFRVSPHNHCHAAASSIAGKSGIAQGQAYTASKFAVRGLTQSIGE